VNNAYFLKAALNAKRKHLGQEELDAMEFMQLSARRKLLEMDQSMLSRAGQRGLLGRREEAQRDLPDGGARAEARDPRRDRLGPRHRRAPKVVADGVNAMRSPDRAFIVVTHYQRLLDYIVPDYVHVLSGGRIVKSRAGRRKGYGWLELEDGARATDGSSGRDFTHGRSRRSTRPLAVDGAYVYIPGAVLEEPLQLLFVSTAAGVRRAAWRARAR
jgi:Fe-S cluster assembly ATP-binding protein